MRVFARRILDRHQADTKVIGILARSFQQVLEQQRPAHIRHAAGKADVAAFGHRRTEGIQSQLQSPGHSRSTRSVKRLPAPDTVVSRR